MCGLVNNSHNIYKQSTWIKDMKGGRGEGEGIWKGKAGRRRRGRRKRNKRRRGRREEVGDNN